MYYISSLSGGVSSAVATDRAIKRYGRKKVVIWFADTLAEDGDLYRFIMDCMDRWGGKLHYYADGRTPVDVAEERNIIPNQKIAPCTHELKIKPFTEWLWRVPKNVTVLLGYNWDEIHRIEKRIHWHKYNGKPRAPMGYQAKIPGVYEDYPLLWKPLCFDAFAEVRSWGIEIPELYKLGFSHNNCGGKCWRQNITDWLRLKNARPDDYNERKWWEKEMRKKVGDYAILRDQSGGKVRPLTLEELEQRQIDNSPIGKTQEDLFSCVCGF